MHAGDTTADRNKSPDFSTPSEFLAGTGKADRMRSERAGLSGMLYDLADELSSARRSWNRVATSPFASNRSLARLAALHSTCVCARIFDGLRLRMGGTSRRA